MWNPMMPTTQNVMKNRMDFPVWDKSITNKIEAVTRGMIQDKNRELPFYPDPIYRPPTRQPENLQPQNSESKADTSPKQILNLRKNSPYHRKELYPKHTKGQINLIFKNWKN